MLKNGKKYTANIVYAVAMDGVKVSKYI